jgi:hypothetical protein
MASSSHSRKKSVDMAAPVQRVSRIRRDPPPKAKEVTVAEIKERDARNMAIGITGLALALFVILIGFSNAGWSPSQYTIHVEDRE